MCSTYDVRSYRTHVRAHVRRSGIAYLEKMKKEKMWEEEGRNRGILERKRRLELGQDRTEQNGIREGGGRRRTWTWTWASDGPGRTREVGAVAVTTRYLLLLLVVMGGWMMGCGTG